MLSLILLTLMNCYFENIAIIHDERNALSLSIDKKDHQGNLLHICAVLSFVSTKLLIELPNKRQFDILSWTAIAFERISVNVLLYVILHLERNALSSNTDENGHQDWKAE